ncbi:MAG: hypothetical protein CFH34_00297 [Alphaproteobacteria bacterium MarineAlpha9_Bin4]|nr:hypothetical protein [Pelagibacterales bacterium]PPR27357.1 MAG: hypothetical protein CFH34_00297 [Alphaproteobacteria bacterium MarineAlpha9_Bin4]
MSIKIKLQIYLILLSFILVILNFLFNDLSVGRVWFLIDGNSLVGVQSYLEEASISQEFGVFFYEIIISILNFNLFLILGIIFILISFCFFIFSY